MLKVESGVTSEMFGCSVVLLIHEIARFSYTSRVIPRVSTVG